MFNKKISLLFITLVFILSISAVAAYDTTAVNDDLEMSEMDEEPPSGSALIPSDIKSVSNDEYSLQTKDLSLYYKNGTRYEVTLTHDDIPVENADIIINICGVNYTRHTNENGVASIAINLNPGIYSVSTFYNYNSSSIVLDSGIEVLSTIAGDDVVKTFKNDTQYYASFLDNNGNPLVNSEVTFNINGVFYTRKTNENGIAKLNINLHSGNYIITATHQNGLMYSNLITVLPSISASDITKFYKNGTQYYATFFNSNGNALVKGNVTFNINGVFYQRTTDENGVAKLNINLHPGSYILTAINPVNGEMFSNVITVLPTIISSDMVTDSVITTYSIILLNGDGSAAENKEVEFILDGVSYNVVTDEYGVAAIEKDLKFGLHTIVSHDKETGLYVANIINETGVDIGEIFDGGMIYYDNSSYVNETLYYSQYGVSPDNKTIMAIGRPSASGELSTYGYKFYLTIFERVCPYCGSSELYWGIFWTGDETTNYGLFPATGHKEGGSAEGHIFCADCDADWSVFGNEHVYGGGTKLKAVSTSIPTTKDIAYMLKNGEMIYSE